MVTSMSQHVRLLLGRFCRVNMSEDNKFGVFRVSHYARAVRGLKKS